MSHTKDVQCILRNESLSVDRIGGVDKNGDKMAIFWAILAANVTALQVVL